MEAHPTLEFKKNIKTSQDICGGPMVVEAPGQLPSLPSPKSGPVYTSMCYTWLAPQFYFSFELGFNG